MAVLEDKRSETPFAARDNALDMRVQITELSFRRFGKKPRKIPNEPRNFSVWSEKSQMQWKYNQAEKRTRQKKVEEMFRSWIANYKKYMSKKQITNMVNLYRALFGGGLDQWMRAHSIM